MHLNILIGIYLVCNFTFILCSDSHNNSLTSCFWKLESKKVTEKEEEEIIDISPEEYKRFNEMMDLIKKDQNYGFGNFQSNPIESQNLKINHSEFKCNQKEETEEYENVPDFLSYC
ncbi:uncharacterized protein LOC126893880 [Daktulosphaira vitifoliae]|uniref:uncharacterized protein LOC126893880 n=1 Tax=Daktulosphaira vitifoliae TaxID=58002 RepID=UPI0021AA1C09|nr:uncharacterized protein LOC126893880 [Daktulosphaira vitifoliae]